MSFRLPVEAFVREERFFLVVQERFSRWPSAACPSCGWNEPKQATAAQRKMANQKTTLNGAPFDRCVLPGRGG